MEGKKVVEQKKVHVDTVEHTNKNKEQQAVVA